MSFSRHSCTVEDAVLLARIELSGAVTVFSTIHKNQISRNPDLEQVFPGKTA